MDSDVRSEGRRPVLEEDVQVFYYGPLAWVVRLCSVFHPYEVLEKMIFLN